MLIPASGLRLTTCVADTARRFRARCSQANLDRFERDCIVCRHKRRRYMTKRVVSVLLAIWAAAAGGGCASTNSASREELGAAVVELTPLRTVESIPLTNSSFDFSIPPFGGYEQASKPR